MRRVNRGWYFGCFMLLALGCLGESGRVHRTDGGGVLLFISDFLGLPTQVSVNTASTDGGLSISQLTIRNIPKDPNALTSQLMNVQIERYEVIFERTDGGSRVPPPLVRSIFGSAPVNGTETYLNLPIMTLEQIDNAPLADLLFANGAFDKETGLQRILLRFRLRFFGRTLSGDRIDTDTATFTIEFVP